MLRDISADTGVPFLVSHTNNATTSSLPNATPSCSIQSVSSTCPIRQDVADIEPLSSSVRTPRCEVNKVLPSLFPCVFLSRNFGQTPSLLRAATESVAGSSKQPKESLKSCGIMLANVGTSSTSFLYRTTADVQTITTSWRVLMPKAVDRVVS